MKIKKTDILISADFETTSVKDTEVYWWGLCLPYNKFRTIRWKENNTYRYIFSHKLLQTDYTNYLVLNQLDLPNNITIPLVEPLIIIYGIRLCDYVNLLNSSKHSLFIFFQNGARFDLHFLVPYITKIYPNHYVFRTNKMIENDNELHSTTYQIMKFRFSDSRLENLTTYYTKLLSTEPKYLQNTLNYLTQDPFSHPLIPHEYTYLCDSQKAYISFQMGLLSKPRNRSKRAQKNHNVIQYFDSYKLFAQPLAKKGKQINIPKLKKLDNYDHPYTYNNIKEFEANQNEFQYAYMDTVVNYLHTTQMLLEKNNQQNYNTYLTTASNAYHEWTQIKTLEEISLLITLNIISSLQLVNNYGKSSNRYVYKYNSSHTNPTYLNLNTNYIAYLVQKYGEKKGYSYSSTWLNKKLFHEFIFQTLILPTTWLTVEKWTLYKAWYFGGLIHVNEDWRGYLIKPAYLLPNSYSSTLPICTRLITFTKILSYLYTKKIFVIDSRSHYMSVMVSDALAPWGAPLQTADESELFNPAYYHLFTLIPKKDLHNPNVMPLWFNTNETHRSWSNSAFYGISYLKESCSLPFILKYYANNSIKTFFENFVVIIDETFKAVPIKWYYQAYKDKFYTMKLNAKSESERQIAKDYLTNLYGKNGQKMEARQLYYNQDFEDFEDYETYIDGYYLPLASEITELGRLKLALDLKEHYAKVLYTHTDSMFIYTTQADFDKIQIFQHPTQIGSWDVQGIFDEGYFRRANQYIVKDSLKHKIKHAFGGVNFEREFKDEHYNYLTYHLSEAKETKYYQQIQWKYFKTIATYEAWKDGFALQNQQRAKKYLPYGVVIEAYDKEICPVWDYEPLINQKICTKEQYNSVFYHK